MTSEQRWVTPAPAPASACSARRGGGVRGIPERAGRWKMSYQVTERSPGNDTTHGRKGARGRAGSTIETVRAHAPCRTASGARTEGEPGHVNDYPLNCVGGGGPQRLRLSERHRWATERPGREVCRRRRRAEGCCQRAECAVGEKPGGHLPSNDSGGQRGRYRRGAPLLLSAVNIHRLWLLLTQQRRPARLRRQRNDQVSNGLRITLEGCCWGALEL